MRIPGFVLTIVLAVLVAVPVAAETPSVESRIERAKAAMIAEPADALRLARSAAVDARDLPPGRGRDLLLATSLWLEGEARIRMNDAAGARAPIERALTLIQPFGERLKLTGDLLLARAGIEQAAMQPARALGSLQRAHRIFVTLGEARSQSLALMSIATLYSQANDLARADRYFAQAADAYSGDRQLLLFLHNNRGNVLLQMERYPAAIREYRVTLAIARALDSRLLVARVLGNIARAEIGARRYREAGRVLAEGLALIRTPEARAWAPQMLAVAAELAYQERRLPQAAALLDRSLAGVDPATTTLAFRDAHLTAYKVYRDLGRSALSLRHLEALRRLGDEATSVAISTNAALMAARFDYANQELRIANLRAVELRRRIEVEQARSVFQRTIFIGAGAATLVLLAVLSVALVTIRRSRNQVRAANTVLEATNTALEKALAAKTEFLATTSHEIRTPLNGILGMTQVMLADPRTDAGTRDRIGVVHGAGLTMRALVDDILDVAKMETGNLTVEAMAMDLTATLRDVTRLWEEQARGRGIGFALDLSQAPEWIESDPARLRQILFNLLSNALKFTEAGDVRVSARREGDRLRIAVSDSGIGIPADKLEAIFESFRQADSGMTRRFGGTGLGLTICRNLARALGGDVLVESREGTGSTFTVDLPLIEVAKPDVAAAQAAAGGTLLILERNPIARAKLKTLFERRFDALMLVADPDEARAALARSDVRVLIADEATLKAAGDPVAVVATLHTAPPTKGAALAVLWTDPDTAITARLIAAGADRVIAKPIAGPTLIEAVGALWSEKSDNNSDAALVSHAA